MHGRDGVTERYVAIGARILSYKEVPPSCSTDKCCCHGSTKVSVPDWASPS